MKSATRSAWRFVRCLLLIACAGGILAADNTWLSSINLEAIESTSWFSSDSESDLADMSTLANRPVSPARGPAMSMADLIHGLVFSRPSGHWTLNSFAHESNSPVAQLAPIIQSNSGDNFGRFDSQSSFTAYVAVSSPVAHSSGVPSVSSPAGGSPTVLMTANDPAWIGSGGTETSPASGLWSGAANWSPPGAPGSSPATVLSFGGSGTGIYTSTNDLGTFTFGTINLYSSATVTETIDGNALMDFGGATISQNSSGKFEIRNDIIGGSFNENFIVIQLHLTSDPTTGIGTVTLSGVVSNGNNSFVRLALLKDGPNTFVLTGSNTFSGGTTVNGGTLLVNNTSGSGTGSALVTVNNSGTLGGTGTITVVPIEGVAQVNVNSGGTIAPGNGPGQIGPLSLNDTVTNLGSSSTLLIDIGGMVSDRLLTTGVLNLTAGSIIDFNQLSTPSALLYQLATYSSINGAFTPMHLPAGYELFYNPNGTELDLVFTAIPEPATWLGAAVALGALLFTQRRRFAKRS